MTTKRRERGPVQTKTNTVNDNHADWRATRWDTMHELLFSIVHHNQSKGTSVQFRTRHIVRKMTRTTMVAMYEVTQVIAFVLIQMLLQWTSEELNKKSNVDHY